jgi:CRP-like cAMP-binding protein
VLTNILDKLSSATVEKRDLRARQFLFRQGDKAMHIFAVEEGHIKLIRYLSNGKSVVMHVARPGHTFTEAALFSDVYHCNAVAEAPTRVRMYRKEDILEAVERDRTLALEYIGSLSSEVQRLRMQLELHNIRSAPERVLQFLMLQAPLNSLEFKLQGPLTEAAAGLGLAHETFYRALARLEDTGAIRRQGRNIRLQPSAKV